MLDAKVRLYLVRRTWSFEIVLTPFGDLDGRTALEVATRARDWEGVHVLVTLGANVNAVFEGASAFKIHPTVNNRT